MTEIAFHFNVQDRLLHACRVIRKALGQGHSLVVTAPPGKLAEFDQVLWSFAPVEFLPHCSLDAGPAMVAISPVLLVPDITVDLPYRSWLIHLGDDVPSGFGQFEKMVEIVSEEGAAERQAARARWKHYSDRGYPIVRHDLAASA